MRILIVDDNTGTLNALKACAVGAGHEVLIAKSPGEALTRITASVDEGPEIDVLVTDLKMPGMDGLELIGAARKLRTELRAVLMTAYGNERVKNQLSQLGWCAYLEKPFGPEEFIRAVDTVGIHKEVLT